MTWTKQTKPTTDGVTYGYGTQAYGSTPYGGSVGGNWTKIDKPTDVWSKQTKPTDTWTTLTKVT